MSQSPAHHRVFASNIWHSDQCQQFHSGAALYKYQHVLFLPRQDSPVRTFEYYRLLTSPRLFPTAPPSYNSTVWEKRESMEAGYKPRAVCVPGNWACLAPPASCVIGPSVLTSSVVRGKYYNLLFSCLFVIYHLVLYKRLFRVMKMEKCGLNPCIVLCFILNTMFTHCIGKIWDSFERFFFLQRKIPTVSYIMRKLLKRNIYWYRPLSNCFCGLSNSLEKKKT